jgi:hypothetical protein
MTPFYTNNFEINPLNGLVVPNDYLSLMNNQQFKNKLTYLMAVRKYGVHRSKELSLLIKKLLDEISNEIVRLRNEK